MFAIFIKEENSMTAVENHCVVCDQKSVKIDDEVKFVYGGKIYDGVVKMISGNV